MVICLLIAILGFAIYAVSSIVTDRLLERRIKDIEEKMNGFVKRLDIPTIEDGTPTKIASLDPSFYKELAEKYGTTSGSDMVNGLTYKDNKVSETQENPIMKPVEKRKATGKLAELVKEFNDLPCEERIRRISDTRVEMEKELWINRACEWLKSYRQDTLDGTGYIAGIVNDKTIEDFRKAMMEEQTMTQENKELLLKDLCVRLPYGVKVYAGEDLAMTLRQIDRDCFCECWENEDFKCHSRWMLPYLRPMSSMTKKEKHNYFMTYTSINGVDISHPYKTQDWLNVHHFDYRGLIEKGLAIAVTEENNPYV